MATENTGRTMRYTAFISHSNKDRKALDAVRDHLESCGYACFASERDLLHNAAWQTQLVEAMDDSTMLIYLHSKNSNESAEVSREINYFADKCHRPILIYRLDDVPYNIDRAYYLQSINYIDSLSNPEEGLDHLAADVQNTLDGLPAEGRSGKRSRHRALGVTAVLLGLAALIAVGYYYFHAYEQEQLDSLMSESSRLLSRTDHWLAEEDSLTAVLPAIGEAERLAGLCSGFYTAVPAEIPDFAAARARARSSLEGIRNRRIETVKALYEPLKYATPGTFAAAKDAILDNIGSIRQLDSVLNLPGNAEISTIQRKLITLQ